MSATNMAPDRPERDVLEAERLDDDVETQSLGEPDQPGDDRQRRQVAEAHRPEYALLKALVELEDARRQGQPNDDPPSEVPHREQPDGGHDDDDDADDEHEPNDRR